MFPRTALIVLGLLLAAMAALVLASVRRADSGKHTKVAADIGVLDTQLKLCLAMNGALPPTTEQGLRALVEKPTALPRPTRWRQLIEFIPTDPWNREYVYPYPGIKHPDGLDLFSTGPNRTPDTADDVWDE